jgi:hypothetical protein
VDNQGTNNENRKAPIINYSFQINKTIGYLKILIQKNLPFLAKMEADNPAYPLKVVSD